MNEYCTITFQVTSTVEPGETLYLSGDHGALGGYIPEHAREMFTTAETYPTWKVKVLLPRGIKVHYSYLKKEGGELADWEFTEGVTRLLSTEDSSVTLSDIYGLLPTSIAASSEDDVAAAVPMSPSNVATPQKELILVAFNLPVFLRRDANTNAWVAEWDQDNVAAKTERSVAESMRVTWIGAITPTVVRGHGEDCFNASEDTKRQWSEALSKLGDIVPVFLDYETYDLHYAQFCKVRLWDIFHNVLRPKFSAQPGAPYSAYQRGNSLFAAEVMKRVKLEKNNKNTICWVHDYHLMLVPKMLRDQLDFCGPIILFLHTPFPTSEIFRTLTTRHELLAGMLASTTIGFHTFNHGRHFVTACKRFLGATSRSKDGHIVVEWRDRRVLITISHLGVDAMRLTTALEACTSTSKEIATWLETTLPTPQRRPIVFGSFNPTQRLRGVTMKLLAFERLLSNSAEMRGGRARYVLWTQSATSGPRLHDSTRSLKEIKTLIKRINDAHKAPVVLHREFTNDAPPTLVDRVAMWLNVDVYVNTAVSEGLNLMPLEYLFCRGEQHPGALIVSEFSTCSSVLNGAIRVNCYDVKGIASAMESAARMSLEEKRARRQRDMSYIDFPSSLWAQHLIQRVLRSAEDLSVSNILQLDAGLSMNSGRALSHVVQCKPLDASKVAKAYEASKRRLFLLDFGGTLVEREHENLALKRDFLGVHGRGLSDKTRRYLKHLSSDPRNLVFVISSDTRTVLSRVFSELLERPGSRLGVVAHSGLFIRIPNSFTEDDDGLLPPPEDDAADVPRHAFMSEDMDSELDGGGATTTNSGLADDSPSLNKRRPSAGFVPTMSLIEEKELMTLRGGEGKMVPAVTASTSAAAVDVVATTTTTTTTTTSSKDPSVPTVVQRKTSRDIGAASSRDVYLSTFSHQISMPEDVDEWRLMVSTVAGKSWSRWLERAEVIPIMERFTWSTGGAQFSSSSITDTFDYTRADAEWGLSQANSLVNHLTASLKKHNLTNLVDVRHAKGVVQLLPRGVDKGRAANDIMQNFCEQNLAWAGQPPDFCVCIGDDASDEFMFEAMHDYFLKNETVKPSIYTSTVGRKPTKAKYYLRDVEAVQGLLATLCKSAGEGGGGGVKASGVATTTSASKAAVREEDFALV